jgi:hypothetical protein
LFLDVVNGGLNVKVVRDLKPWMIVLLKFLTQLLQWDTFVAVVGRGRVGQGPDDPVWGRTGLLGAKKYVISW